jgi:hypothetical protein
MKVAWHEVPGIDPTKIRPEGYGVNSVSRFHIGRPFPNLHTAKKTMGTEAAVRVVDHTVPYGTDPLCPHFPGTSCQATFMQSLRNENIGAVRLTRP